MSEEFKKSATPAQYSGYLKTFIGKKVTKLVRYSWWPKEEVSKQCGIPDNLAFSLTAGPFNIVFENNSSIGISSNPGLNSVIVWNENARNNDDSPESSLIDDKDLFAIFTDEEKYCTENWRQFPNQKLINLSILKRKEMTAKEESRASEVGLKFMFENGAEFIASHGLHDDSDDFSVIDSSMIEKEKFDEIFI